MLVTHEQTAIQTVPYEDMQPLQHAVAGGYSARLVEWHIPESASSYEFSRTHNESPFRHAVLQFADTSGVYPAQRPNGAAAEDKPFIAEVGPNGRVWFYDARQGLKTYVLDLTTAGGLKVAGQQRPDKGGQSLHFDPGNTIVFGWVRPKHPGDMGLQSSEPTFAAELFREVITAVDTTQRRRLFGGLGRHSVRG